MDQDDKAHYIIKDLVSSWRHVRFLSNFIVCPVEEKYKCTYYKCQPDGTMKPIKTVVRTDLIFDEDELRNAEDRKNTRKVNENFLLTRNSYFVFNLVRYTGCRYNIS